VRSLKQGTDELKKMNDILKLDDIEKLMDDTREAVEYQNVRHTISIVAYDDVSLLSIDVPLFRKYRDC
jgi:hypothetical protein